MLTIAASAILGGLLALTLLWEHGPMLALLSAPFCGSSVALAVGLTIAALGEAVEPARRPAPAPTRRPAPMPH